MKSTEAEKVFDNGFNCAQAVTVPFAEEFGMKKEEMSKLSSVFGAGMARMQETCGAVTGAFMVLGLRYGFTDSKDQQSRDLLMNKSKEFIAKFKERFGTLKCGDLITCDLNTGEGQKKHKDDNQRQEICMKCVKHSAEILESIMRA